LDLAERMWLLTCQARIWSAPWNASVARYLLFDEQPNHRSLPRAWTEDVRPACVLRCAVESAPLRDSMPAWLLRSACVSSFSTPLQQAARPCG